MNAATSQQHCAWSENCAPMQRNVAIGQRIAGSADPEENRLLCAFLRKQAEVLIDWTLTAELEELLARCASVSDSYGRTAFVRNGYQPARNLLTNLGPVKIRIPKVRSRIEQPIAFRSALAQPYLRRTRAAISRAPAHFLRGFSTGDLHTAISALMGPEAAALPAAVIRRLTGRWEREHKGWLTGSLARLRCASLWLDSVDGGDVPPHGIGSVMLAVAIDESACEQILAVAHGARETAHGWAELLRNLRNRGMPPPLSLLRSGKTSRDMIAATAMVYPETLLDD